MERVFKGKCKNCPFGEKSKDLVYCFLGGIRELNSKCNIVILKGSVFRGLYKIEKDSKVKKEKRK